MLLGLPDFEYVSCSTLKEACAVLAQAPGEVKIYAGGTDLLVKMKHRAATPRTLVNIKGIAGLDQIEKGPSGWLRIGALATMREIASSPLVRKGYEALGSAAAALGTPQIRALATLGGNLGNASPAAESGPALLVLEARVAVSGPDGLRTIPMESFFAGPGKTALLPAEIITEVQIPAPPQGSKGVHLKYGSRKVDVAMAGASVLIQRAQGRCQEARIALNSVGPTPFRARGAEEILRGEVLDRDKQSLIEKAAQKAAEESAPIDDIRASRDKRQELVRTLVRDAVNYLLMDHTLYR